MSAWIALSLIILFAAAGWFLARMRAFVVSGGRLNELHSLPGHHAWFGFLAVMVPAFALFVLWMLGEPFIANRILISHLPEAVQQGDPGTLTLRMQEAKNYVTGGLLLREPEPEIIAAGEAYAEFRWLSRIWMTLAVVAVALGGLWWGTRRIARDFRARQAIEGVVRGAMFLASVVAVLTTVGIFTSLIYETSQFFETIRISDFVFGTEWSPQMPIRRDQAGASGAFGAIPLLTGTLLITFIAMCVAIPLGFFSAIYMADYASARLRAVAKPVLEILAGIPTVVFGFFAIQTVSPLFREAGAEVGLRVSSESALAAGVVMGIMIIPFISSLSDDVMNAVPQSLRDGSYAMGATKSETIKKVVFPAALPGIVGAILLAVSRAIGETMIVVMAAGLTANLTANPLEAVTTFTVQIVTLLVGDSEFDSPKTLAAFALGLLLFTVTLVLNFIALDVVKRYRERYD